jgi:colanic acid/amylovoran biosynthesis glycosyltransferase
LKITYITNTFPKLSETFVLGQITELIDRGHNVEIISISKPAEHIAHEDVINYGLLEKTHYLKKKGSSLGFEPEERLIYSLAFTDIIHAHFAAQPATWALKISKTFDIPYVITTHAYDIYINPDTKDLKEKFANATKIITTTNYNKKYLSDLLGSEFGDNVEIVKYGIDISKFSFFPRKANNKIKILFVGRMVEKKGPSYAIEAFKLATAENPEIELRMIGDGPLKNTIDQLIKELQLENVTMLGGLSQSRVLKEMEEADIFFLPSLTADNGDREGSPVSILEAAATGLPVVSTQHTGIPEIVIDGVTGFLVPEKDTNAMSEALKKLITHPELRHEMGKKGRSHIETNHDRKKEMDHLEKIFNSLIENRSLISSLSQTQLYVITERTKRIAKLLQNFDSELNQKQEVINQRDKEMEQRDKEMEQKLRTIKDKDEEIKLLKERLASTESKFGYKLHIFACTLFKKIAFLRNKSVK